MDVDDAKASSDSPVVSKSRRGSFEHLIHDEHSKQLEKRVQEVLSSSLECVDRTVQGVIQSQKRVQESIQQLEKVLADADTRHTALDINDPVQKLLQTRMRVERISKTLRDVTNRIENMKEIARRHQERKLSDRSSADNTPNKRLSGFSLKDLMKL